jgi:PIN domain nuclease of toxin-antitoxin system
VSSVVLDASAVLALLFDEPGADVVEQAIRSYSAVLGATNLAEVLTKAVDKGIAAAALEERLARIDPLGAVLRIEPLTEADAVAIAGLRPATRAAGLGLGDRAWHAWRSRNGSGRSA